jgi:hypothetical protein
MLSRRVLRALARRGVSYYTIMTWESRLFASHYRALIELAVIGAIVLAMMILL